MTCTTRRIAFWTVFLLLAAGAFVLIWKKLDPLRFHPVVAEWWIGHNFERLESTDAATGVRGWNELQRLYLSSWIAYDRIVWRVKQDVLLGNETPIHFHLTHAGHYFSASTRPTPGECRTVTEAMMAILHQEQTRRTPYRGDWQHWWSENAVAFPNRDLIAPPEGPERPGPRR